MKKHAISYENDVTPVCPKNTWTIKSDICTLSEFLTISGIVEKLLTTIQSLSWYSCCSTGTHLVKKISASKHLKYLNISYYPNIWSQ